MKLLILTTAAAMALTGAAFAESAKAPTMMTDAEMDRVVAGAYKEVITPGTYRYGTTGNSQEPPRIAVGQPTPKGFVCVAIGGSACGA